MSRVVFTVGAGGPVVIGILNGHLSGFGEVANRGRDSFPSRGWAAVRVQRRLRAVQSERPFDASDALLVSMLFAMECIALLGLGLVAPQ